MANTLRRTIIKSLVAFTGMSVISRLALAAWPQDAFDGEDVESVTNSLYGSGAEDSDMVKLKAPDIAENGAVVPISVSSDLPNVESISILVDGNPNPLASTFELTQNSVADVSTRIKMGKTSNVIALVKADGKVHKAMQEVKVTIGGCGG